MKHVRGAGRVLCALFLTVSLSGCALFISDPEERAEVIETNDPIEGVNRHIFAVNLALDTFVLRPISVVYREFMPDPGKDMVRNFVHNLKLPFTAINDLLQGEPDRAETAMSRFLVNTTAGVGGLFDAATGLGLEYHEEDFGQTLAVHGSEEGPYLMLPIFGPSNLRDAIGLVVQYFTDPVGIAAEQAGADDFGLITGGMEAVDSRSRHIEAFDALQQQSLDFYAAVRSLYRQRREAEIRNFQSDAVPASPIAMTDDTLREAIAADADERQQEVESRTVTEVKVASDGREPVAATSAVAAAAVAPAASERAEGQPSQAAAASPRTSSPTPAEPPPVATSQLASLPESARSELRSGRVDGTGVGLKWGLQTEGQDMSPRQTVANVSAGPAPTSREAERMDSFAEALRAFDNAARSFDQMSGVAPR